jgi:hypothetical protein
MNAFFVLISLELLVDSSVIALIIPNEASFLSRILNSELPSGFLT